PAFHGEGQTLWSRALIISALTLLPYILTWIALRSRTASSYTRRLFKSLCLLMIFDVGGWLLSVGIMKLIYTVDISINDRFVLSFLAGWPVHFGLAVKPLIYYFTSIEYRAAFRNQLSCIIPPQQNIRHSTS
ncbi:hypothetical protein PENTCL1PPCAC_9235, partial [Pristionchus entomophagus]